MRGGVTSWTVPVRGREGYTSEISVVNDANGLSFTLSVTTHSLEEHVWLTRPGQRVYAEDVLFDSPWDGRAGRCVLEEEGEKRENTFFRDFAVDKITGMRCVEGGSLVVSLLGGKSGGGTISCVDSEKRGVLLEIGVGGLVQLFNVKVSRYGAFVTERSGVRKVELSPPPPAPPLSPPLMPPPVTGRKLAKWRCLGCGMLNYPSKTVCRFCRLTRKQGPLCTRT